MVLFIVVTRIVVLGVILYSIYSIKHNKASLMLVLLLTPIFIILSVLEYMNVF